MGKLKYCHTVIKVFGGTKTMNFNTGTIKWSWLDNTGSAHEI